MGKKINITLQPLGKTIKANPGTPLIDLLHEYGVEFPCGGKGTCGACKIKLLEGKLDIDPAQKTKLQKLNLEDNWRLACFCKAESDLSLEIAQFETIILADNSSFDFTPKKDFGIAVDIGSTTVVAQLVNLENGHILDSVSELNPQTKFGSDLIARIQACLDGNQDEMQGLIRNKVGSMISEMLEKHRIEVTRVSLVGNTVMHHIFCGLNVKPLAHYPFESPNLEAQNFNPKNLDWQLPNNTDIIFYPSIGSFVGSDILAGLAATKMADQEAYTILIDLGTNGEIAIGNRNRIVCASTAAGPAFEGAKISHGMRATTGAISSIDLEDEKIKYHVIGNVKAKGICGSGLVDIVAHLIDQQKIGMFGEIVSGEEGISISKQVSLTQQDIREFQLAKAAFATGIQMLLNELQITMNDVEKIFIAGGFGNFLNIKNVLRTGLLEADTDKITKLGNSALIGAKMFLFKEHDFLQNLLNKTKNINLEGQGTFQDIYVEKMMLI